MQNGLLPPEHRPRTYSVRLGRGFRLTVQTGCRHFSAGVRFYDPFRIFPVKFIELGADVALEVAYSDDFDPSPEVLFRKIDAVAKLSQRAKLHVTPVILAMSAHSEPCKTAEMFSAIRCSSSRASTFSTSNCSLSSSNRTENSKSSAPFSATPT